MWSAVAPPRDCGWKKWSTIVHVSEDACGQQDWDLRLRGLISRKAGVRRTFIGRLDTPSDGFLNQTLTSKMFANKNSILKSNIFQKHLPKISSKDHQIFLIFFPHITVGFLFSCLHPAFRRPSSAVRVRRALLISHISHYSSHTTHHTQLISHHSSHTTHLTHHISHTTHLTQLITHNSSHTTHLTQLTSHNSSHTQLISHNSSRTPHLTQLISHTTHLTPFISHTTHLTQVISHTTHLTQFISHTTHLTHNSSHTIHLSQLPFVWQAQYTEPPEGAVARIVAAVAAARFCVAGAVRRASWRSCGADSRRRGRGSLLAQYAELPEGAAARIVAAVAAARFCVAGAVRRASWRSCGADSRRRGRGSLLRGRRSTQSLLKEVRRG